MDKFLTDNLDVIASSNLEIRMLDGDLNIIQKLDDEPNDVGGLSSAELKAEFDKGGNIIKKYINETLIPAILAGDATEASRAAAEAARVSAEQGRESAETARQENETAREEAESARKEAEDSRVLAEQEREKAETTRQNNETAREEAESARSLWEEYNAEKAYVPGNKVAFGGSSYLCIAACTGIEPTNTVHWLEIAEKGADGGTVETTGAYGFSVENGNLFLHYTGDEAPPFSLDESGHLWLKLGNEIDLGRVKGDTGDFLVWQIYDGVDLTEKFADEIAEAPYNGDPWAWIRARIRAANYSDLHIKDYIPFVTSNGLTFNAEIAGIDTYYNCGNPPVQHHIDFISRELWPTVKAVNPAQYNNGLIPIETITLDGINTTYVLSKQMTDIASITQNGENLSGWRYESSTFTVIFDEAHNAGTATVTGVGTKSPWLASDLYHWLNSLSGQVPASAELNPDVKHVDYTEDGVYFYLPQALKNVISPKRTMLEYRYSPTALLSNPNGWGWENLGSLWLPSESEVYGSAIWGSKAGYALSGFALQYPIFSGNMKRVKLRSKERANWWLLPPDELAQYWCCVSNTGIAYSTRMAGGVPTYSVPICFRVA